MKNKKRYHNLSSKKWCNRITQWF